MPGMRLGVVGSARAFEPRRAAAGAQYPPMAPASAPASATGGAAPTGKNGRYSVLSPGTPFGMHVWVAVLAAGVIALLYFSAPR